MREDCFERWPVPWGACYKADGFVFPMRRETRSLRQRRAQTHVQRRRFSWLYWRLFGAYKEGNRRFEPQPKDSVAYRGDDLAAFCQFCQMTAPLFCTAAPI
ncbi:MAG: hypothetical protein DBY40_02840 [Clostridiales bacterium]|nr:MAG: hypothetical protein DBY40_02840 [Clostridiales bacterium]